MEPSSMDLADLVFLDLEGEPSPADDPQPSFQQPPVSLTPQPEPERREPQRVGIVLDHHHLEVAAKQQALATHWEPTALVSAIEDQLSGGGGSQWPASTA
jgi:hypothetical protein